MERYNNEQIRITNINQRRLARMRKARLRRNRNIAIAVASVGIILTLIGLPHKEEAPHVMPEDYVQIYIREDVEHGDTLTEIAERYYDDDVYDSYYGNINNYIDSIADTNDIYKDRITPYQSLTIPVFVGEENIYLTQIAELEEQIKNLPKWVNYTVEVGDTILGLAYRGAGSTNEAYSIKDDIMAKNGLKNSNIRVGQVIQIVNPQIGELKAEIVILKEKLHDSAKVDQAEEDVKIH